MVVVAPLPPPPPPPKSTPRRAALSSLDANIQSPLALYQPPPAPGAFARKLKTMSSKDKLKEWTFPRSSPNPGSTSHSNVNSAHSTPLMAYAESEPESPEDSISLQQRQMIDHSCSSSSGSGSGSDEETRSEHGRSSSIPPFAQMTSIRSKEQTTPNRTKSKKQHQPSIGGPTSPYKKDLRHRANASVAVVAFGSTTPGSPPSPQSSRRGISPGRSAASLAEKATPVGFPTSLSEAARMIYSNVRRKSVQDLLWLLVFGISLVMFVSALIGYGYVDELSVDVLAANEIVPIEVIKGPPPEFLPKAGQLRNAAAIEADQPPADVHQPIGDDSHDHGHEFMRDSPDDQRLDDEHVHHHHDGPDALFDEVRADEGHDDHSHDAVLEAGAGLAEVEEIELAATVNADGDVAELEDVEVEEAEAESEATTDEEQVETREEAEEANLQADHEVQGEEEHGGAEEENDNNDADDDDTNDEAEEDGQEHAEHDHGEGLQLESETDAEVDVDVEQGEEVSNRRQQDMDTLKRMMKATRRR